MQSQELWLRPLDDGNIADQQAEHALAVTRCGGLSGPESREVAGQLQDLPFLFGRDGTQCLSLEVGQLGLEFEQPLHRIVPALFGCWRSDGWRGRPLHSAVLPGRRRSGPARSAAATVQRLPYRALPGWSALRAQARWSAV